MKPECKVYYESGIGWLEITGMDEGIKSVLFVEATGDNVGNVSQPVADCVAQLDEYFGGKRQEFSVKLAPEGTAFQQRVWQQLLAIPYGETVSYMQIARAIGNEKAIRAVGAANGA